ncbi:hypothetical protein KC19_1G052200 [Ceratodon purpureus]|uniref:Remorin C-terminal domain-containing protein n=1 Tax=Ceratodon purpureus TaxID=3225 RepID=A0A8T0J2L8_CERPU|nr:hypothetical protein KC19_1G052200 [Ceratodon purpureus]
MVTCSQIVDGGRWKEELAEQAMKSSRPLVYDVETGSLRFFKSRAALNFSPKSPDPHFTPASFNEYDGENLGDDSPAQHKILGKLHRGGGSGENSPTCVIQNSAVRSNSSSPTMSTISKTSSDPGRKSHDLEGRSCSAGTTMSARAASSPEYDEEYVHGVTHESELQKIGDGRGRMKQGNMNTSGRPGLKGPPLRRMANDPSGAKENGWATPQGASRGEEKEARTPPFKSIQSAVADKTLDAAKHKKNHGGIPCRPPTQSASIMHMSPGVFSFNATYMSRADSDHDDSDQLHTDTPTKEIIDLSRRTFLTPLLKPPPSKWDDAEKWLPGSESLNPARAKSRSGPLLAQMVAIQAGMSIPSKTHLFGQPRDTGLGQRVEAEEMASEPVVKNVTTSHVNPKSVTGVIDFTVDEKKQLNLLLDRYSAENGEGEAHSDGSLSPSRMNGSFMKLGARTEKQTVKPSTETRDMGTAMTPIPSLEPSRTGTPLRETTREKRSDDEEGKSLDSGSGMAVSCDNDADSGRSKNDAAESPRALTEKELQEKTRKEIVALGTQLGKANIAAAWAAKEAKESVIIRKSSETALDVENIRRDVLAVSTADAWKEAEKAKYTSRFEQEEAKIAAWEEHEKAKAEAEMRRVEVKVERMKAQAQVKLTNKLAAATRQAKELRQAAETKRTEAAAKAARKAELMKTHGKITNLFFLSFLCT